MENQILERLSAFVAANALNALSDGTRIYDAPIIGIAAANDPLFEEFKMPGIVGPGFLMPEQWLPGAKSVVSYFLPFTEAVRVSNRKAGAPSREWMQSRIDGEKMNTAVHAFLQTLLSELGGVAASPCLNPRFQVVNRVSNWSERHVAYAAGLGTFGLHRALITQKGSAGRFGSAVTTLFLQPSERKYHSWYEYCLYLSQGKCGKCMQRCPGGAITRQGKDHGLCFNYLETFTPAFPAPIGCAKCNTSVPCEARIPVRQDG